MKRIGFLSLFVVALAFSSCKNNNANNANTPTTTQPSTSNNAALEVKWKIANGMDADSVNPRCRVAVLINSKEVEIFKERTLNYEEIPKNQWANREYSIPADAFTACSGFWAGFDSKMYLIKKGENIEVYEGGFSEDETVQGLNYQLIKTIKPEEWK
jgi:hypothetical protein